MSKLYTVVIIIGIILQAILLLFFEKEIAGYGPVIFWGIAGLGMFKYFGNILRLSASVRRSRPSLFKKYSFGGLVTRNALKEDSFLNSLNHFEQTIIQDNNTIFKFLFICFGLFVVSIFVVYLT